MIKLSSNLEYLAGAFWSAYVGHYASCYEHYKKIRKNYTIKFVTIVY